MFGYIYMSHKSPLSINDSIRFNIFDNLQMLTIRE